MTPVALTTRRNEGRATAAPRASSRRSMVACQQLFTQPVEDGAQQVAHVWAAQLFGQAQGHRAREQPLD
jgi:hypothetical protein